MLFVSALLTQCAQTANDSKGSILEEHYNYDVEEKIKSLGIELAEPSKPVANFVNAVRTGNQIFMAGKGPSKPEGGSVKGKVGALNARRRV